MKDKIEIVDFSWHRNGISGNGFYAVLFDWTESTETRRMVATLFDQPGSCAVLEVAQLKNSNGVTFGFNSWRGDSFERELRQLIKNAPSNRVGPFSL